MKIAFVSFEYPPDTGYGGIGTYVLKAARVLQGRAHHIEVFAASPSRQYSGNEDCVLVHRVKTDRRDRFNSAVVGIFSERHQAVNFDVIESPEYFHEASEIARAFPEVPLVAKLHSPSLLIGELQGGFHSPGFRAILRGYWAQLRRIARSVATRRSVPKWYWRDWEYRQALERDAAERAFTSNADLIVSPSHSLLDLMLKRWQLDPVKCFHAPNPYDAPKELLDIPVETDCGVISYFGRLETRKGLLLLAKVLPSILEECRQIRFRFVGRDGPGPNAGESYQTYLQRIAGSRADRLEFTGQVTLPETYRYYSLTDICVFPSVWENFPNVCLEAMAAGRGIVGSSAGGMAEMIAHGSEGLVVEPKDSEALLRALLEMVNSPVLRKQMGQAAREKLLREYAGEKSLLRLETSYHRAVENRTRSLIGSSSPIHSHVG